MKLIAIQPFAEFKTGDEITDSARIHEILEGEQSGFVVQVQKLGDPDRDAKPSKTVALKG